MCAERRLAVAFLLALAACGGPTPDLQPHPASMEPRLGYLGRPAAVVVHGDRFFVKAAQTGGSPGYALAAGFRAWLGGVPLEDVRWLDERTITAQVPGTLPEGVHALVLEGPHGARGELAGAFQVVPGRAPSLAGTLSLSSAVTSVGQALDVALEVANDGDVDVRNAVPELRVGGVVASALAAPGVADVPAHAATRFTWRFAPTAAGMTRLEAIAVGVDAQTGERVESPVSSADLQVLVRPAQLVLAVVAAPARVNAGQSFSVTVRATNLGEADASDVLVAAAVPGSTSGPSPAATTIPGGESRDFVATFTAGPAGTATAQGVLASGTDASDGRLLSAATAFRDIQIDAPAELTAAVVLPIGVPVGDFTATLVVTNTGDALATGVLPEGPPQVLSGTTAPVALKASGANPPVTIGRGERAIFTWTYTAGANGVVRLGGGASGTDANDGALRNAPAPPATMQVGEAIQLASDPLGGSSFSFVFGHGGKLWLGPTRSGSGAARCDPANCDASLETLAFSFFRDTTGGNVSLNKAPPYSSLGHTGCTPDSGGPNACGPDDEDGRGFFTSGVLGGQEWIVAGGARSGGDLDYVYLSPGGSGTVPFSFVDLSMQLGGNTRGFSAALVFNDRLYLGFPDNGGNRPYGVVLTAAPAAPGLDADTAAVDLQMHQTPLGGAPGSILMIDTFAAFGGRLYAFNNGGCVRSSNGAPVLPTDFTPCTPSAAAWTGKTSIAPTRQYDLEPADRAVPQAVAWNGRLYMGRNTTTGPQLWACDPARGGDAAACDPADWSLVAPNASGDPQLTQLGDPGNARITVVAATAGALYVGYDNTTGVRLYRTTAAAPARASDFSGASGCVVGSAGCTGLGGAGLGGLAAKRFFDARALDLGGATLLYVTVGDGTAPVSVYAITE